MVAAKSGIKTPLTAVGRTLVIKFFVKNGLKGKINTQNSEKPDYGYL